MNSIYFNPNKVIKANLFPKLEDTEWGYIPRGKFLWWETGGYWKLKWGSRTLADEEISAKGYIIENDKVFYKPRVVFVLEEGHKVIVEFETKAELETYIKSDQFRNLGLV